MRAPQCFGLKAGGVSSAHQQRGGSEGAMLLAHDKWSPYRTQTVLEDGQG